MSKQDGVEGKVREIRRKTRRKYSAEEAHLKTRGLPLSVTRKAALPSLPKLLAPALI